MTENKDTSLGAEVITFKVESGENVRLDVYLTAETDFSRSHLKNLIDGGKVLINGCKCKSGKILKEGDVITAVLEGIEPVSLTPKDIPLDILYEDDNIIVINKQRGLTVHPAAGNYTDTLVNALVYRNISLSSVNGSDRPGIVHRLDKDTTGVMVAAKNNKAHAAIAEQFSARQAIKIYRAILDGNLKEDKDLMTTFIGRSPSDRKKMAVLKEGRVAITEYRVLERFERNCLTEFNLHTGRTHQIRVHAAYLGHSVVGDKLYGKEQKRFSSLEGQLLHSYSLTFKHPESGQTMTFTAPVPPDFQKVYEILKTETAAKNGGGEK